MVSFRRSDRAWKQINYRAATCVLTAEFLHGLYQRHDPFVNPIKFASTRVVFRPWQAISYAPASEWELLGLRYGGRLLRDLDRCEVEIRRTLANPRQRSRNLADALDGADLSQLCDDSLGDLLIDAHHTPLGDIYEVNLVQVEHALHVALRSRLVALGTGSDAQIDATIADLVVSAVPSRASYEERDFLRLALEVQGDAPERVSGDARLALLAERQRAVGAAYGAKTASVSDLQHRLAQFVAEPRSHIEERLRKLESGGPIEGPPPGVLDDCCLRLIDLLREMSDVRDRNKTLMGRISRHRDRFLEEIATRRDVEVSQLRLYLLEELLELLDDFHHVPRQVIEARATRGIVFSRSEDATWADVEDGGRHEHRFRSSGRTLNGLCASPGVHSGPVRIVRAASDLKHMRLGDVLVAPGTDFDLAFLIQMAGAVVTEEGGLLSHAAVLTRELSIPCLIAVNGATECLEDSEWVEVDATAGEIRRVARPHVSSTTEGTVGTTTAQELVVPIGDAESVALGGRKAHALALLARHGFDVPQALYVVPTTTCEQVLRELDQNVDGTIQRVAETIVERFESGRISVRSSTTLEDGPDGSAAGVFESVIDVEARPEPVLEALRRVLDGLRGHVARAYTNLHSPQRPCGMAILVSPYVTCELQGASYSQGVWDRDTVLVEWFESQGRGGCPASGGTLVEFSRSDLQRERPGPAIASFVRDLQRVASVTLDVERLMGTPVQLEWGVHRHRVVVLQARPIVPAARARRRTPANASIMMAEIAQRLRDGSVPLVTGRSHAHARIVVTGRPVFVKVCTDPRRLPRLESEYAWLQRLTPIAPDLVPTLIGLAPVPSTPYPAVLATAEESGRSLQALLEAPDADGPMLVRRFGHALAHLHGLPRPVDRITVDGQEWNTWRAFVVESAALCMDDITAKGGELAASLRTRVEALVADCDLDLPAEAMVVVHGDPTPDNLLLGASGAVFTDFEVTQIGDPWLDVAVAGLLWLDKRPEAWPHFQAGYGRVPNQRERARIHVYRVLRALRLMRGKVWIYRDAQGFARDRSRLMELLDETA